MHKYALGKPAVFFRHERIELSPGERGEKVRIFAVSYREKFISGNITLPEYIEKAEWVELKNFNPRKYFKGRWLKGVREYLRIRNGA